MVSGIMKDVHRLQKALEPKADVHRHRNLEELKAYVLETEALIKRLPSGSPDDLWDDLELAVKGIVTPRKLAKKAKVKPELWIDDLDEDM